MKRIALLIAVCAASLHAEDAAQTVVAALAPNQSPDLFGGRKQDVALVVYCPPQQKCELLARVFQVAGKLAVPVPPAEQKPLSIEPGAGIKRSAAYPIELPKVERKTRFLVRLEAGYGAEAPRPVGAFNLTLYPEDLLRALREHAEKHDNLFALASAQALVGFLKSAKIRVNEIGASIPPEFATRGVIFAQREADESQSWPSSLREGQALVVFSPPDVEEPPRIDTKPLGHGVIVHVKMNLVAKLADGPRAQELLLEIINFVRTQPTQTP